MRDFCYLTKILHTFVFESCFELLWKYRQLLNEGFLYEICWQNRANGSRLS